jgi:hypothetical protein
MIESNIPGYVASSYGAGIPNYMCMRQGFVSCLDLNTFEEGCFLEGKKDNGFFCVDQVRDHIHRYSLLGAGMKGPDRCP